MRQFLLTFVCVCSLLTLPSAFPKSPLSPIPTPSFLSHIPPPRTGGFWRAFFPRSQGNRRDGTCIARTEITR